MSVAREARLDWRMSARKYKLEIIIAIVTICISCAIAVVPRVGINREMTVIELKDKEGMVRTETGWYRLKTTLCRDQWLNIRVGDRCVFLVTLTGIEPIMIEDF